MKLFITEIADLINGQIEGKKEAVITGFARIQDAKSGDLCFLANLKYKKYIYQTNASAVVISKDLAIKKIGSPVIIRVKNPYLSFTKLLEKYHKPTILETGISEKSSIGKNVKIGKNVYIGCFSFIGKNVKIEKDVKIFPNCFIGDNVEIKAGSVLFAGVKIYSECQIGKNNTIHAGSVIGSDGFGFASNEKNQYSKINQIGNVILENNIEIGANTTIDRATIGSTVIKEGVKLDNQIQIGHNVEVGKNTVIAGHVAIAGSTKIGENCMVGGNSSISGHLIVGNNVKVAGHSAIGCDIEDDQTVQGPFAFNLKDFQRSYVIFRRLPEMYKKLEKLYKEFNQ